MQETTILQTLAYVSLLLSLVQTPAARAIIAAEETALLDLYTQKEPYSGRGLNQSSDTCAPEERVILYAYVTYGFSPLGGRTVTFEAIGPTNNTFFVATALTNATGIATVNFTIPQVQEGGEMIAFGLWRAIAGASVAQQIVSDTLTFRVAWIIEISSLKTLRISLEPATTFMKGTSLTAELALKNVAMGSRKATILVGAIDKSGHVLSTATVTDFEVCPGESSIYINLKIPEWADLGDAKLYAGAYTALPSSGGVSYSPETSAKFTITLLGDLNEDCVVDIRDVAIVGRAFGSYPLHPRWSAIADINQDNKVDIRDIALVASRFGKNDP